MRHPSRFFLAALTLSAALPARAADAPPAAPAARVVPRTIELHGKKLRDDYYWMRDRESLEVKEYLEAENAYAAAFMKDTGELQERIYKEILSRTKETDVSVPYRWGGFYYYSRTEQGKQYPIQCRKKGSLDAPEEVFLDVNALAVGERFMAIGQMQPSDDGHLLAYTKDRTGFRDYTLHVRDLTTGKDGPELAQRVRSVAWAADGTLFYTTTNLAKRPNKLWRHAAAGGDDVLVAEENDDRFNLSIHRSRDRKLLALRSGSHTQTEWRLWPADKPEAPMRMVAERKPELEYEIDTGGGLLYIRTNDGCRNFRVVTATLDDPSPARWKELVPCRADVMVEEADVFAGHLVLTERTGATPRISVRDLATGGTRSVPWQEPIHAVFGSRNREYDTRTFRVQYESFTTPASVYDIDLGTLAPKLLKRTEVPGGYDPSRYISERGWAAAPDGTKVPISILYRKGFTKDGKAPAYLTAYGSYGAPYDIGFDASVFSLVDRGFVYAVAHIRGGGDMGKAWHDQGRMLAKKNTFTDFIAAGEALVQQKWTSKEHLAIEGGSAGGLLMGAVTNMRPDLFAVVTAHVPFVDVINTMLDESLPLTVEEFEEWGNPRNKDEFEYMMSYSPYDNVAAKAYPTLLVKTSFDDSQVMYWEPAKWVAKLRARKTDKNPLVFQVNMAGGHGGASGRYDEIRENAYDLAFTLKALGLAEKEKTLAPLPPRN